jgi:hypothetical protein
MTDPTATEAYTRLMESGRLTARVAEVLATMPEARRTELELAEYFVGILLEGEGVVVQVDFRDGAHTLQAMRFDGASLGLHHVGDEFVFVGDE